MLLRWAEVRRAPAAGAILLCVAMLGLAAASCGSLLPDRSETPGPAGAARSDLRMDGEPVVRVRIAAAVDSVVIAGPTRVAIGPRDKPGEARYVQAPVTVTGTERGWNLADASGQTLAFDTPASGGRREALQVRAVGATLLSYRGSSFPGEIILVQSGASAPAPPVSASPSLIDVVEHVGVESYLPGVIARELLNGWSPTTYKAQAIAARTYALHERQRSIAGGESFDLEAGELDQMYGGAVNSPVAERAVRETRGIVLTWQNRLLRAYYSSTCGGRSASARDVWPTTRGFEFNLDAPIQCCGTEEACSGSPIFRWSVVRSRDELTRRFQAAGRDQGLGIRNIKSVTRVEPSLVNAAGRPSQYKVFDADGSWWPLSAEQLRTACNWTGSSGLPAVTRGARVSSGDLELKLEDAGVRISGRGFGHGVGLCQYGAEARAKAGESVTDILKHYYPGAAMERAY